jgi:hypothetical protein
MALWRAITTAPLARGQAGGRAQVAQGGLIDVVPRDRHLRNVVKLEKSLLVLEEAVIEGRKTFANIFASFRRAARSGSY